jgi:two-component system phosphate regulon sensor histidine kinase PhoR
MSGQDLLISGDGRGGTIPIVRFARVKIGMRWWLAAAFAVVAAITAVVAVEVFVSRTEHGFRSDAEAIVVGRAVTMAEEARRAQTRAELRQSLRRVARSGALTVYVLDRNGRALAGAVTTRTALSTIPHVDEAVQTARDGGRYISSDPATGEIVVAVGVHDPAGRIVLGYARRRELTSQVGLLREGVWRAALLATLIGAAVGLVVASLTGRRLRRIAAAARRIEAGEFTTPVPTSYGDEVGSLAASVDSMRLRLRGLFDALSADRDRLEQLLDRLHDGVIVVERDLTVSFANACAREMFGLLAVRGDALPEALRAAATRQGRSNESERVELGERVLRVSPLPPRRDDEPLILLASDESARERAEWAQREFSTNASHQLRTPVAAIVSSVEMLQSGAKDEPAARDAFLEAIEIQAMRLTRLTGALLSLARADARQETMRPRRVPVESLLQRVADGISTPARPVVVAAEPVDAWADNDLLEQALVAATENAVRHARSGVILAADRLGDRVRITISDDGLGMNEEQQSRAFERFYSTRSDGFGLGLAIARRAVSALGGEIHIEHSDETGTCVAIDVPTTAEVAAV